MSPLTLWFVVACVLYIVEIVTSGFVILGFAIGATLSAITAWIGGGTEVQIGAFIVGALLFFFFIRPVLMRRWKERHARLPKTNAEALIGRKGKVTEAIDADAHTGRVQIDGDNLMARSADGETIPANAHVTVNGLDSTILIVKRYD